MTHVGERWAVKKRDLVRVPADWEPEDHRWVEVRIVDGFRREVEELKAELRGVTQADLDRGEELAKEHGWE